MQREVNTGLGIFNNRAILNETAHLKTADPFGLGNIIKRALTNDRIGADPECCTVMAHALVENVLDVCSCPGQAFNARCRPTEGRIGSLRHRYPRIIRLLQEIDKTQAILTEQDGISIKRQKEFAVREGHVAFLATGNRDQDKPIRGLALEI